ncbi:MAG: hypothetical protein N2653_03225 [Burkholderiales bacterium]|nr:hypothetical protein [Burkholderiales bacterium]
MSGRLLAALLALLGAPAFGEPYEVLAPPAGTRFAMRCDGGGESRWIVAKNEGGLLRVQSAVDPGIYREGPVWAYMLGDIYDVQGLGSGRGRNRMFLVRGAAEGVTALVPGARHRFTYRWLAPNGEAERTHVITVRAARRVATAAFGEVEAIEVTDDVSGPLHDLRRSVDYAPALRMFVRFSIRNQRSGFEQTCTLAFLSTP